MNSDPYVTRGISKCLCCVLIDFPLRFDVECNNFLNPCILMDFPIHIDTISMELPIVTFKGLMSKLLNYDVFLSLNFVLTLANSAEPDEMQPHAAFHLGLYCLP